MKKKMNNKGFSLVELIVVIAIMAVLIGVLAPTLLGNIEKSKLSKDKQAIDELYQAWTNTLGDPKYEPPYNKHFTYTCSADGTITINDTTAVPANSIKSSDDGTDKTTVFTGELVDYIGSGTIKLSSKYYKSTSANIVINISSTGKVSVVATGTEDKGNFNINE
ncbi:MAG: type II secretion system protein [Candidatus Gastranaerophilaceae bacterium]